MIAIALKLGISKKQLLYDFYFDEINDILEKRIALDMPTETDSVQYVGADEFF